MYRNIEYHTIAAKRSLLEIILDVHMTTTGSYDRYAECQERDVKALQIALNTWQDSQLPQYAEFDHNVKRLLNIALEEYNKYYPKPSKVEVQIDPLEQEWNDIEIDDTINYSTNIVDNWTGVSFKNINEDKKD